MRGLKPPELKVDADRNTVASFTDAWIETYFRSRERYLKASHLLQMRGLKHLTDAQKTQVEVASFTDAWIETCVICRKRKANAVASFTDAWIETRERI